MDFKRHYTEPQHVNIKNRDIREIASCFEHFKKRYNERINPNTLINFGIYWENWVRYLRGKYITEKDGKMLRMIGSYSKGERIFKVIYKKINVYNIYVPITIYEVFDHKKKFRMNMRVLKNKRNEKVF